MSDPLFDDEALAHIVEVKFLPNYVKIYARSFMIDVATYFQETVSKLAEQL